MRATEFPQGFRVSRGLIRELALQRGCSYSRFAAVLEASNRVFFSQGEVKNPTFLAWPVLAPARRLITSL